MDRQSAYTELLQRHRAMIWRLCWVGAKGNYEYCRDLVQDVSIALWLRFDRLRPDATPREERARVRWQARSVLDYKRRRQHPAHLPITSDMADSLVADDGNDMLPQHVDGTIRYLRPVLIYSRRHSLLAKMGLLITDPDDPRLWNFSGQMDDFFDPDLSFWYSKYKTFYKLKAMGYQITSPFELIYPEVYHSASDSTSANYRFWILGLKF